MREANGADIEAKAKIAKIRSKIKLNKSSSIMGDRKIIFGKTKHLTLIINLFIL